VSAEDLEEMRNECTIEVKSYESLFEDNVSAVKAIEKNLILKLLGLLSPDVLPPNIYKVNNPATAFNEGLLAALNNSVNEEFKEQ
jgi:hypothetical protein